MKDTTEKAESRAPEHAHVPAEHEPKAHASSEPLLKKTKSFGWLQAAIIAVPLALVGIFIVLSTFAATPGEAYVAKIYPGILGRAATASDIKYWGAKIDSKKSTETAVFTAIYNSPEAQTHRKKVVATDPNYAAFTNSTPPSKASNSGKNKPSSGMSNTAADAAVKKAYKEILHSTNPDVDGLIYWKGQLTSGKMNEAAMRAYMQAVAKDKAKPANLTASQCQAKLLKQFTTDPYQAPYLRERIEGQVRDIFSHYTLGEVDTIEFMQAQIDTVMNCKQTLAQVTATVKASSFGKARAAADAAFRKNIQGPVYDAFMEAYLAKIAEGGSNTSNCRSMLKAYKGVGSGQIIDSTCFIAIGGSNILGPSHSLPGELAELVRKGVLSLDSVLEQARNIFNDASASPCPESPINIPSCANGEQFMSQEDSANIAAQQQHPSIGTGKSSKPSSSSGSNSSSGVTSPLSPASGTNVVNR